MISWACLFQRSRVSLFAVAVANGSLAPAYAEALPLEIPATTSDRDATQPVLSDRLDALGPAPTMRARPQETLRGVVAEIDQRYGRISVRLTSLAISDFKVQDGLLFDAVRYGDAVELTVETIGGEKTIVGLRKE